MKQPNDCPFCGGNDLGVGHGTKDREGWPTWIYCADCGAQGPWFYTHDESIWNNLPLACEKTGWNRLARAQAQTLTLAPARGLKPASLGFERRYSDDSGVMHGVRVDPEGEVYIQAPGDPEVRFGIDDLDWYLAAMLEIRKARGPRSLFAELKEGLESLLASHSGGVAGIENVNYFADGDAWVVRVVGRGYNGDDRRTTTRYTASHEDQAKRLCWYLTGQDAEYVAPLPEASGAPEKE